MPLCVRRRSWALASPSLFYPKKATDLGEERPPDRLALEQYMVPTFERDETSVGDSSCNPAALLKRTSPVITGVENECRNGYLRQQINHVYFAELPQKPDRVIRRRRLALQIIEPVHLLSAGFRDEGCRKDLAVGRIVAPPTLLRQG